AGLFFVTASRYGFTAFANLILAAVMGAVYALCARLVGRLTHGRAPRRLLSATLAIWTGASALPLLAPGSVAALWTAALAGSAAAAAAFPVVERYLTAGRHGAEMRSAIGKFNLTWTPATAVPLLVLPLLARASPPGSFALSAAATSLAWVGRAGAAAPPGAARARGGARGRRSRVPGPAASGLLVAAVQLRRLGHAGAGAAAAAGRGRCGRGEEPAGGELDGDAVRGLAGDVAEQLL